MVLFHFNNNKELRTESSFKPKEISDNNIVKKFNNPIWNDEFGNDFNVGDVISVSNDNRTDVPQKDKISQLIKEHDVIFLQYSTEELNAMSNKEKAAEILEKYVNNITKQYKEKFPENIYDIKITSDGNRLDVYIYDKQNKETKLSSESSVEEFMSGNFDVINYIENPLEFMNTYRNNAGGKTIYTSLIDAYREGKLSSEKVVRYLNTLQQKFDSFEVEYDNTNPKSKLGSSSLGGGFFQLYNRVQKYFEREQELQKKYKNNEINREQVKELQQFIKENYHIELNEIAAAKMISDQQKIYGLYEYNFEEVKQHYKNLVIFDKKCLNEYYSQPYNNYIDKNEIKEMQKIIKETYNEEITEYQAASMINNYKRDFAKINGINLDKFKSDCLNGKFVYSLCDNVQDYLTNILCYSGNGYNDSLESLEEVARYTEIEYGRYNFDISKSPIADLAKLSQRMIEAAESDYTVSKTRNKFVIKNNKTGEERVIDLSKITSLLDSKQKQIIVQALNGFNNISLWEFAIEVTSNIDTDLNVGLSLAEYCLETDSISISNKVDSNTLLHEMVHAMMATIIDGKNTSREPLFKEFVDTFNSEQRIHNKDKQLRNSILGDGNYTYCAENIYEFAAEAGCLWLSGKSDSEFTIATHFPKSYRLFVQLIEKIRSQEIGRSLSK